MKRINVTFYDEIFEKLSQRAQKNHSKSVAHQVRELVDLGLRVEDSANQPDVQEDENTLEELIKKTLSFSLESRLLLRSLISTLPSLEKEKAMKILQDCKEKSHRYAQEMSE